MKLPPASPVLMDEFQFLQPDAVRILREVRATMFLLDPCLSLLLKAARKRLADWVGGGVSATV